MENLPSNDGNNGPKIIDLDDLNLDSEEWKDICDLDKNMNNPFPEEEVLGSFFQLGDKN